MEAGGWDLGLHTSPTPRPLWGWEEQRRGEAPLVRKGEATSLVTTELGQASHKPAPQVPALRPEGGGPHLRGASQEALASPRAFEDTQTNG